MAREQPTIGSKADALARTGHSWLPERLDQAQISAAACADAGAAAVARRLMTVSAGTHPQICELTLSGGTGAMLARSLSPPFRPDPPADGVECIMRGACGETALKAAIKNALQRESNGQSAARAGLLSMAAPGAYLACATSLDCVIAGTNGIDLLLGFGPRYAFASSDARALTGEDSRFLLSAGDIALLWPNRILIIDRDGMGLEKRPMAAHTLERTYR